MSTYDQLKQLWDESLNLGYDSSFLNNNSWSEFVERKGLSKYDSPILGCSWINQKYNLNDIQFSLQNYELNNIIKISSGKYNCNLYKLLKLAYNIGVFSMKNTLPSGYKLSANMNDYIIMLY